MLYTLMIINRSGGLIFSKSLSTSAPQLSTNELLRLGSTFHGLYAIVQQVAPVKSKGFDMMETDNIILKCFQTLTGLKFIVSAPPGPTAAIDCEAFLQSVYQLYSDYVLKNPFYEVDMPIRCDLFTKALERLLARAVAPTAVVRK